MTPYRVEVAPRAQTQLHKILEWWRIHRQDSPSLVLDEFAAAAERLALHPAIGPPYPYSRLRGVRRLLLPRSHYHSYYQADAAARRVRILAVWHTAHSKGPAL